MNVCLTINPPCETTMATKKCILQVGEKVRILRKFGGRFAGRIGTIKRVVGAPIADQFYMVAVRFVGSRTFWGRDLRRLPKPKATTKDFFCHICEDVVVVERRDGDWTTAPICIRCDNTLEET